jgi:hypothetical protein
LTFLFTLIRVSAAFLDRIHCEDNEQAENHKSEDDCFHFESPKSCGVGEADEGASHVLGCPTAKDANGIPFFLFANTDVPVL